MRALRIVGIVVIVLIAIRIALPYALLPYINHKANQIPGYHVNINSLSISLLQGKLTLNDIEVEQAHSKNSFPLFTTQELDISIQWHSLWHGSMVAKINVINPIVNLIAEEKKEKPSLTIAQQWRAVSQNVQALKLASLNVKNGELHFRSSVGNPPFDAYLKKINLQLQNLLNTEPSANTLPSHLILSAQVMKSGLLNIKVDFNSFAKQPTFDLSSKLENLQLADINNLLHHYSKVDVQKGIFSLYVEAKARQGKITGYAKPFIKNLTIGEPKSNNIGEAIAKTAAKIAAKILQNDKQKTIATKIKISGNVNDPKKSIWSIIGYLLQHSFFQALMPQLDHSVKSQDIEF